jgi:hypothetical protein
MVKNSLTRAVAPVSGSARGKMSVPRFNNERQPSAAGLTSLKSIRIRNGFESHVGGPFLRDSGCSGRRRIFAIVAPPGSMLVAAIRRILIFDNHPDQPAFGFRVRRRSRQRWRCLAAGRRRTSITLWVDLIAMLVRRCFGGCVGSRRLRYEYLWKPFAEKCFLSRKLFARQGIE